MEKISVVKEIVVAFSDIDALHIVWHGNYVKYFEDAREFFGKKYGVGYMEFYKNGIMAPIVDLQISYKKMVEYGETIYVKITYEPVETAKIIFRYEIFNKDSELVCEGKTIQVMTTLDRKLILFNPDFIKNWKQQWLTNK